MYYKMIKHIDEKYPSMGMVEVRASFFLEVGDEGYDKYMAEHFVTVPVFPVGGYPGKVDKEGTPLKIEDYNTWLNSLPTVQRLNPFCNHAIQFEGNVTSEEILTAFDKAVEITKQNYIVDDLHCKTVGQKVNADIGYTKRKAFYKVAVDTLVAKRTPEMVVAVDKIVVATDKVEELKTVDFTTISITHEVK